MKQSRMKILNPLKKILTNGKSYATRNLALVISKKGKTAERKKRKRYHKTNTDDLFHWKPLVVLEMFQGN